MMRGNLKALGLALIAALALGALAASSASALEQAEFTTPEFPAVISGAQELEAENYFEWTPGQKIECDVAEYEATLSAASTEITVTPHYANCEGKTKHMNGCHFVFTAGTATTTEDVHGTADLVCPGAKKQIETTGPFGICRVDIPAQQGINGITYTNKPANPPATPKPYVTIDINATNVKFTDTDTPAGFCPFALAGGAAEQSFTNGKFVSQVIIKGYKDLGNVNTVSGQTTPGTTDYTEGAEIGVHVK